MGEKERLILVLVQSTWLHETETTRLLNNRRINAGQQIEVRPMSKLLVSITLIFGLSLSGCNGGSSGSSSGQPPPPPPPPPPPATDLIWDEGNWDEENWQ